MARFGLLFCALMISGCSLITPATRPEASAPPATSADAIQSEPTSSIPELDCAPRAGRITCD